MLVKIPCDFYENDETLEKLEEMGIKVGRPESTTLTTVINVNQIQNYYPHSNRDYSTIEFSAGNKITVKIKYEDLNHLLNPFDFTSAGMVSLKKLFISFLKQRLTLW
jgi:hypothetical protein